MEKIVTNTQFQEAIQGDQTIVVKFHADWCTDCKRLDTYFDQIIREYPNLKFYDIDVEELPELAESQSVRGIPSLLAYHKGEKISHLHSANLKTQGQARDFLSGL